MEESIINTYGLNLLYDILSKAPIKEDKLVSGLDEVIKLLERLKQYYEHSSDYHQISKFESDLHNKQQKYLVQWREIERLI